MDIRRMTLDDYDAVYALWLSCSGMGLNNVDDSREGIDRFLQRNPETCLVAEDNGEILGAILVGTDGRRGYIYHTAVSPLHRRQGIAKSLLQKALSAVEALGISKTALVVFEHNKEGNTFWENMGYTQRPDLVYRNLALKDMVRIDT